MTVSRRRPTNQRAGGWLERVHRFTKRRTALSLFALTQFRTENRFTLFLELLKPTHPKAHFVVFC
ncbi:hypothetical protein MPLB_770005 [Mesorhizobium sp. ORS 3324]|nr:hypothetical protein MPLB_770005 [Mesorhizobium sp. ORS 3324]